ncbi:MAG TPA: hypothetical protein VFZ25_21155, partial [Chloroflexota bacterium]|nr:hypothetical protein [Chloroflexota bacterium]
MSLTSNATPSQTVRKPLRQPPRNVTVFVLLAFLAVITLFYAEVIFFGHTLVPVQIGRSVLPSGPYGFPGAVQPEKFRQDVGASTWKIVPGASKVGDAIASHHFPLWNEHEGFGFPLLADMQSGALDPLRLLVDLSNTTVAWDIYYIARSFLGLAAAYAFGRLVKLDAAPSFAFSVAYVFSGHFMIYGNNHWVEIYFLLPVILIGTELVVLGRTRAGVAVTAVSVALSILGGMPEVTLFVFLLAAPYGLFRILSVTREAADQRFGATRLGQLVLAWLIG